MTNQKIIALADKAIDLLETYLSSVDPSEAESRRAKTAQAVLSAYVKLEQTRSARETTAFFVARELTENKEQLARFLKISAPQLVHGLPKALEATSVRS